MTPRVLEDQISLSRMTADGIGLALDQDFNRVELPERMAWVVLLLREIEDSEKYFPTGKWATIQFIESQLEKAARQEIQRIVAATY